MIRCYGGENNGKIYGVHSAEPKGTRWAKVDDAVEYISVFSKSHSYMTYKIMDEKTNTEIYSISNGQIDFLLEEKGEWVNKLVPLVIKTVNVGDYFFVKGTHKLFEYHKDYDVPAFHDGTKCQVTEVDSDEVKAVSCESVIDGWEEGEGLTFGVVGSTSDYFTFWKEEQTWEPEDKPLKIKPMKRKPGEEISKSELKPGDLIEVRRKGNPCYLSEVKEITPGTVKATVIESLLGNLAEPGTSHEYRDTHHWCFYYSDKVLEAK